MINPRHGTEDHPRSLEIENSQGVCVNLGCGFNIIPGWFNVDKYIEDRAGRVSRWDLAQLVLKNDFCDLLYSSHSLEHMNLRDACLSLQEWMRVLKSGGQLIIAVPDTEVICQKFSEKPEWYTQCLYGTQSGPGHIHYYGWTESTLKIVLEKIGFRVDRLEKYMFGACPSIWCEATK